MSLYHRKTIKVNSIKPSTISSILNSKDKCLYRKEILSSLHKLPLKLNMEGIFKNDSMKNNILNNEKSENSDLSTSKIKTIPLSTQIRKRKQIIINERKNKSVEKNKIESIILILEDLFNKINNLYFESNDIFNQCKEYIDYFYENANFIEEKTEAEEFFPLIKNSMNILFLSIILLLIISKDEQLDLFKYDIKKILDNFKLLSQIIFDKCRKKNNINLKEKSSLMTNYIKNINNSIIFINLKYEQINSKLSNEFSLLIKKINQIDFNQIYNFYINNILNPKQNTEQKRKQLIKDYSNDSNLKLNKIRNDPIFQIYNNSLNNKTNENENSQNEIRGYSMNSLKENNSMNTLKENNINYYNTNNSFNKTLNKNPKTLNIFQNNSSNKIITDNINNICAIYTSNGEILPFKKKNNIKKRFNNQQKNNFTLNNYVNYKDNSLFSPQNSYHNMLDRNYSDKKVRIIVNDISNPIIENNNIEEQKNYTENNFELNSDINNNYVINDYNNKSNNKNLFLKNISRQNYSNRTIYYNSNFYSNNSINTSNSKTISYRNSFNGKQLLHTNNSYNIISNSLSNSNSKNNNIFISVNNENESNVIGTLNLKKEYNKMKLISNTKITLPIISFNCNKDYSIIFNLDDTLIYIQKNTNKIYLREGLRNFLKDLMIYYELICFTKNIKYNADQIIDFIENDEEFFSFRLYIENSTYLNDEYYKELSKVGRDIKKTIIIDNKENGKFKNENEILIKPFIKKDKDNQEVYFDYILHNLIRILIKIAREKPNDIRKSLIKYNNEIENKLN